MWLIGRSNDSSSSVVLVTAGIIFVNYWYPSATLLLRNIDGKAHSSFQRQLLHLTAERSDLLAALADEFPPPLSLHWCYLLPEAFCLPHSIWETSKLLTIDSCDKNKQVKRLHIFLFTPEISSYNSL